MHLPTLRGGFSVNLPQCLLANSEKPSGCGTRVEFMSLAVSEPSSCPADPGWRGTGGLRVSRLLGGGASPGGLVDL